MAVSYEKLWKILKEMGISKTEFRKMVNISTVTLAKLSKNEMVSMAAIESICSVLRRPIGEVIEFVSERQLKEWERIEEETVYLTELFYITQEGNDFSDSFLYGYSIAADEGVNKKTRWELSICVQKESIRIWKMTSFICGSLLLTLICCMEQGKSIGEFLEESHGTLHHEIRNKRKEEWQEFFLKLPISSKKKTYRPEIVLLPEMESAVLAGEMQPLHAFGEVPLISESFVSMSKRKLYCDENGVYHIERMQMIHDFFKEEGYLINGLKDLCRIGDFEVFYPLSGSTEKKGLIQIGGKVEELENGRRLLKGFEIKISSSCLSGAYVLEVITYNADNPTACKLYDIVVDGEDIVRTVELPESSTRIEVRLWEKTEEKKIQLAACQSASLMRDIIMDLHVCERTATLEDKYTKKFDKTYPGKRNDAVNRKIEWYQSMESKMEDNGNDPWRKEFGRVEEDFLELYGSEKAESHFFSQGMEAHEAFLGWLKQQINGKQIKTVWIFDPYIDEDSVPRLLRALANIDIQVHVVTDAKAPSRNETDRIGKIQRSCAALGEFLAGHLAFYAFDGNHCLLHDRILLLFGSRYFPYVYNMSNSLDNMGMHTPSIVCKLSRTTAKETADYYLDLFSKEREQGRIQVLWEETNKKFSEETLLAETRTVRYLEEISGYFNQKLEENGIPLLEVKKNQIQMPVVDFESQNWNEKKTKFFEILSKEIPGEWEKIAYFCNNTEYSLHTQIKTLLRENYKPEWGNMLREIVRKELEKNCTEGNLGLEEAKKAQEALRVHGEESFEHSLKNMGHLLKNPYEFWRGRELKQPGKMALKLLIEEDFEQYKKLLEQMEIQTKQGSFAGLKRKEFLIRQMACEIKENREGSDALAEECLLSKNDSLVALGMQWFIQCRKLEPVLSIIEDRFHRHEFFKAMMVDLQVEDCQRKYRCTDNKPENLQQSKIWEEEKEVFLGKFEKVKEAWVQNFQENLTAKQLWEGNCFEEIKIRSKKDVCDLVLMLFHAGKLSNTECENFLIFCLFEKTEKIYPFNKQKDYFWRKEDFENGWMFLKALQRCQTPDAGARVLEKLASLEKKLVNVLHDVFLYKRSYTKWKCYIDMLLWCCAMRAVCRKFWKEYENWAAEDKNLQARQKEIQGLIKKYYVTLEEYSEAYYLWRECEKEF